MSTYADAAASSGPIGAEKIPEPPKVKNTSNPNGNVETLEEDEFEEFKKKTHEAVDRGAKKVKEFSREANENGEAYLNKFIASVKKGINNVTKSVSDFTANFGDNSTQLLAKASEEFKNPVVITQALVGISGLVAGYMTYLERHRIHSDNKVVLATHGAIITGLIVADGYLFNKYYPQYKSKK
mmetsp:Transcript_7032/g.7025  ORF Transcript_7032/g.7025 Transcript_7032/m.7025 type:complete len:183 (+) Transcript_7032:253-801(+)